MQATILLIGDLERNLLRQAEQLSVPRGYLLDICVISDECIPVLQISPHPPAPSPKSGRRGARSKSLSQFWERDLG